MEFNEEEHILGDFEFGFIDINGEKIELSDLQIESSLIGNKLDLIREVYPVIGRINISQYQEEKGKKIILELPESSDKSINKIWHDYDAVNDEIKSGSFYPEDMLLKTMEYNDIVISLREQLYTEIELNKYIVYDKRDKGFTTYFLKLGVNAIRWLEEPDIVHEELEGFLFFSAICVFAFDYSSDRLSYLIKFLYNRVRLLLNSSSLKENVYRVGEIIKAIKKIGMFDNADRLWHIYLITVYHLYLFNEFVEIDYRIVEDDESYKDFIIKYYSIIDLPLKETQIDNSQNMVMMYCIQQMPAKSFLNHGVIKGLYEVLNSLDYEKLYLRDVVYINDKSEIKKRGKCFAAMYDRNNHKKYAAISGTIDHDKYIITDSIKKTDLDSKQVIRKLKEERKSYTELVKLLKEMLRNQYEIIDSDDDVKYYFLKDNKESIITSKEYINSVRPYNKEPGRRMFSCCERKLSTKFEFGGEYDFYIKYNTCSLCRRMINQEKKHSGNKINIRYWKKYKDKPDWHVLDESAREVEI